MTGPSLKPHAYVLAVHDLAAEAAYWTEILGFSRSWNEPGNWEGLIRDGVRVNLGRCPESIPASELGDHSYFAFIATEDVDALHAELAGMGARILKAPEDKPWGWREMPVATPEGWRIMFAQAIS
jgi:catechol 2,3-dioxygenase-like lactoylglutathione lyase family enzyme